VGSRIILDEVGDEKNLITIRNSLIRGILSQDQVTKRSTGGNQDGSGHVILKDGNRKPWQVWEERVEGSQRDMDRMGRAYVRTDVEKREAFGEGDWAGEGKDRV
jgi:hypothetical protein